MDARLQELLDRVCGNGPAPISLSERHEMREIAESEVNQLKAFKDSVIGWRENDWPEGFCRATAELMSERAKESLIKEE
jgi:hypothetical protein